MTHMVSRTLSGWGVALALSAFACGGSDTNTNNKFPAGDATKAGQPAPGATPGTSGAAGSTTAGDKSPITITGCLQKGDGRSDYILTEMNTTQTTVGTTGAAPGGSTADAVGKEQTRAAAHAYKLNGEHDALEPLVGKQVRVSGMLAARSDLAKDKDVDRTKIDESDLAKIDVSSIDSVSDNCGRK